MKYSEIGNKDSIIRTKLNLSEYNNIGNGT